MSEFLTRDTSSFQATVTNGQLSIKLQGDSNVSGSDQYAVIEALSIVPQAQSATPAIADGGFESPAQAAQGYTYDPTGAPWTFSGDAGIAANNSGFTNNNNGAPQGSQVAFLQDTGSLSQGVANFAAGTYTLTFAAAQRGQYNSDQSVQVLVDGSVVATLTPAGTTYAVLTATFTVAAGTHTIAFQGTSGSIYDTAFIDGVSIATASASPSAATGSATSAPARTMPTLHRPWSAHRPFPWRSIQLSPTYQAQTPLPPSAFVGEVLRPPRHRTHRSALMISSRPRSSRP